MLSLITAVSFPFSVECPVLLRPLGQADWGTSLWPRVQLTVLKCLVPVTLVERGVVGQRILGCSCKHLGSPRELEEAVVWSGCRKLLAVALRLGLIGLRPSGMV